jgi:hypothetical protein
MKISARMADSAKSAFRNTSRKYWGAWNPDIPLSHIFVDAVAAAFDREEVERIQALMMETVTRLTAIGNPPRDLQAIFLQNKSEESYRKASVVVYREDGDPQFMYSPRVVRDALPITRMFESVFIHPSNPFHESCYANLMEHRRITMMISKMDRAFAQLLSHAPSVESLIAYDPEVLRFLNPTVQAEFADWKPTRKQREIPVDIREQWEEVQNDFMTCLFLPEVDNMEKYELV